MDATERKRIRDLNALRFENMDKIVLKKAVEAKQAYKKASANLQAQKETYTPEHIAEQSAKIKQDYAAKMAGIYEDLSPRLDELQASIQEAQSTLDLSDTALTNALKLIELGGKDLGVDNINKINQSFQGNQPALRALQVIYKARGLSYDGGIDKMVYDIEGSFNQLKGVAQATFLNQTASINSFASKVAKIASLEKFTFEANPDPDGFSEAVRQGAGLTQPE